MWAEREQIFHGREGFPRYSRIERRADAVIHGLGVIGGVTATLALLWVALQTQDPWVVVSVAIYGIGAVGVFTISAAYHMSRPSETKATLRRLDQAAIFIKIAGTYTPFALVTLGGLTGGVLLALVWAIAAVGAPLRLFGPGRAARTALWLYLVQGWLVVVVLWPLSEALDPTALMLLGVGGVLYTVGVVFYVAERMPFNNAIWHAFVLTASACMYGAVLIGVAAGPGIA